MKRMILMTGVFIGMAGLTSAQNNGSNSSKAPQASDEQVTQRQTRTSRADRKAKRLNNRKIYKWKDGQRATPTGHEATGLGSGYSSLKKDPPPQPIDTARKNEEEE